VAVVAGAPGLYLAHAIMGRRSNNLAIAGKDWRSTERQGQHQNKQEPRDAHGCSSQDDILVPLCCRAVKASIITWSRLSQ
jgi:hypothetical protein